MSCHYLRDNLHRGIREGFYHVDLDVEGWAPQWRQQVEDQLRATQTAPELEEVYYAQLNQLLWRHQPDDEGFCLSVFTSSAQ